MHPGPITSAWFSPNARSLLSVALGDAKSPRLYHFRQPQPPSQTRWRHGLQQAPALSQKLCDPQGASRYACYSPNGRLLATVFTHTVSIRHVDRPADVMMVLDGHAEAVNAVAFSPCGRYVTTASQDGMGRLWDLKRGGARSVLFAKHEDDIQTAAFSPDGRYIVTASRDRTAKIYDFDPGA